MLINGNISEETKYGLEKFLISYMQFSKHTYYDSGSFNSYRVNDNQLKPLEQIWNDLDDNPDINYYIQIRFGLGASSNRILLLTIPIIDKREDVIKNVDNPYNPYLNYSFGFKIIGEMLFLYKNYYQYYSSSSLLYNPYLPDYVLFIGSILDIKTIRDKINIENLW